MERVTLGELLQARALLQLPWSKASVTQMFEIADAAHTHVENKPDVAGQSRPSG
tara:strand:- start:247 stop:408 length:162 start_codon:yes stop_codon:yes gene_type:complete